MDNQNETERISVVGSSNTVVPESVRKKNRNVLAIAFGVMALVFAGLAVFFGIEYFKPKDNGIEQGSGEMEKTAVRECDEKVVDNASDMAKDYLEVKNVMEGLVADIDGLKSGIDNDSGLAYKPEGFNTYIPMRFDFSINVGSSTDLAVLKTKLEEAGFNAIGTLPFFGSAGPLIDGYLNSDSIVCGVYSNFDALSTSTLECAKTDWTWLTDEEKSLLKELEGAYYDKTGQYPLTMYGFETKPKDSSITPYQTLQVAIGGGGASFYRTSPEAKWQFFAGGQAAPDCDAYDTDDLRKAFAGSICYDTVTGSSSTVEP